MEEKQKQIVAKAKANSQPKFDLILKIHGQSTVLIRCTIDESLYNIIKNLIEEYRIKTWTDE
jgi:hypothetical protein